RPAKISSLIGYAVPTKRIRRAHCLYGLLHPIWQPHFRICRQVRDATFARLFGGLLLFVYHCFDRLVIHGYLSGLSRPEQVVYFFRQVVGVPTISREVLSQRTSVYQNWVEAFARNRGIPIEWAESGVRKKDY